jgi:DNA-binding SARP family transcriptional activator
LLGGFAVEVDGRLVPATAWRQRRGADVVKLLALADGHRLQREQLMESLWPGLEPEAAARNLRKAVHHARRALGGQHAIARVNGGLALWPDGEVRVDAVRAEAEAARALARHESPESALELVDGELLPEDRYAEWSQARRDRLADLRLQLLRSAGRWESVRDLDPMDEEAFRALMRAHLDAGNRSAVVREFRRLRDVLRVDLGVAPEPATVALFEEALSSRAAEPPGPAERAQALLARGLVDWNQRELDAAERAANEVRQLAFEHHLGRELGEASSLLGMVAFARGRWLDRFRRELAQAVRIPAGEAIFVLDAQLCLAEASLASADSAAIARLAHELLPVAIEAGSVGGEALMSLLVGEAELFAGRLDESREWVSRSAGLYEEVGGDSGRSFALVRLAEVAIGYGRMEEAVRMLAVARTLAERSELNAHLRVRIFAALLAAATSHATRQRILGEAEAILRPGPVCGPCSIGYRIAAGIACARSSQVGRAREHVADAERISGIWQGGPWRAAVWEAKAELRVAEGQRSQGAALMREAGDLFRESGRPLDEARCLAAADSLS